MEKNKTQTESVKSVPIRGIRGKAFAFGVDVGLASSQ
jgi:hypothetical protein